MTSYPQRIISLVPSQTELLWDLGLQKELVGITKFCIHPKTAFDTIQKVGGTKNLNVNIIDDLAPDLIIANKEENEKEQILSLQKKYPVHVTEIYTLNDALNMVLTLGKITGKLHEATALVSSTKKAFAPLQHIVNKPRVLYLIWKKPYMVAGKNTIVNDLLAHAGFENCIDAERYPVVELDEIKTLNPDYIFLSSEPYPFSDKNKSEFDFLDHTKVIVVDGEMFSWYGSRLLKAPAYYTNLRKSLLPD